MFHVKQFDLDVIVVGGGHAGAEAAAVSARAGARTELVTLRLDGIGVMSCNPAIGGLGKGHLVREVDALDGVMGRIADLSGIQFRLLNRRKGPAVQGPRAQIDRKIYRTAMQRELSSISNLEIIEGEVADFLMNGDTVAGVVLADGSEIRARSVVLTTGTFLRGLIRIGESATPAGRAGDRATIRLAQRMESLGLPMGRLKTGTPPRLDGRSIDWGILDEQRGDDSPVMFSFLSRAPAVRQISCGITHTNAATHAIIERNLTRSAIYGGHFESVGPRYCPSVEDKVVRFREKDAHQVFLEPEGLDDHTVYPNGISTSLPADVQSEFVRTIRGLESVRILQPGYAIEYDFVDPKALRSSLELRCAPGLYLAGQINGTTGYEEAAAQGLVAGLNAAMSATERESVSFPRTDSYIGVMIDDLVTRGVTEPYRMFTSRAEYRLSLRADNADQRLTPLGMELGVVATARDRAFADKERRLASGRTRLAGKSLTPQQASKLGIQVSQDGVRRSGIELLSFKNVDMRVLAEVWPDLADIDDGTAMQIQRDSLYANYEERQRKEIEAFARDENQPLPDDIDYMAISGLSGELCAKLDSAKPETLGQAGRIEGMTPPAMALILARIRLSERRRLA